MATTSQFTIDGNTRALYHMDGTVGSAGKLDNAEGTSARDITETGTLTAVTGVIVPTSDGAYRSSSGNSNYLTFTPSIGTGQFTVEGWIQANAYSTSEVILSSFNASNYIQLAVDSTLNTRWSIEIQFSDGITSGYVTAPSTGVWNYVAITYDQSGSSSVKIYINGTAVTYTVTGGTNARTGTVSDATFRFYRHAAGAGVSNSWDIDEFRFSNTARSATEISNYYNGARRSNLTLLGVN